ncbi:hypothetical protein CYMTET_46109 [Cymbomonas tetramitiformis]|uniref:Uncharacterized protein n=1 Tax=Cymbomonas tetramitiformis TaxID=36881 RepID=A0AAE0BWU3_9CHLO|nr:hypothetical protein CYMTET_46109 [Cymbomonas tetramitiformis]
MEALEQQIRELKEQNARLLVKQIESDYDFKEELTRLKEEASQWNQIIDDLKDDHRSEVDRLTAKVDTLSVLLKVRSDVLEALNSKGASHSALHQAAFSGDLFSLKTLLQAGLHVDLRTEEGATPLHFAAGRGHKVPDLRLHRQPETVAKQLKRE